tara:strand:+ start:5424 stop:8069 length:2646 start_codon:yes stop_codon:yes gene_type:complete
MSDSNTEPKEFQIKLRYKVGPEIHYTTLEQFEFLTIRDSNMIDKEKQKVKEEMNKKKPKKIWNNIADDYKELKEHLKEEDKKIYKFFIPLSTNYFTFDNLQSFLNEKKNGLRNNSDTTLDKLEGIEKTINELKTNPQLKTKVNSLMTKQVNDGDKIYIFSLNDEGRDIILDKLFTREMLRNLGYLNKELTSSKPKIETGINFICRFLYLIFNIKLQEYFKNNEELFDITDNPIFTDKKAETFLSNCKDKGIIMFYSLESIEIILENLKYLDELSKRQGRAIPRIKSLKNCNPIKVNAVSGVNKYTEQAIYVDSSEVDQKIHEILLIRNSGQQFILERIGLIVTLLRREFDSEISNELNEYKKFDENKSKLFLKSAKEENTYLKKYFEFLQENLIKNDQYNFSQSAFNEKQIAKHNTNEGRKQKVKDYGKYILDKEEYGNSDIDKIYDILKADPIRLSYVITYYNIFKILETFFLTNGCILHHKFFRQDGAAKIKKSEEKIYVKVKSIKCIQYNEEMLRDSFEGDRILKPIYEIEFEEIPTYSNVIFYVNLIDKLNPSLQLEETLDNYKRENPNDKKTILDINSETLIYKRHTNDMFSKNKNIHRTKIFIKKNLDIKKMVNRFSIIKSNHKIFKSLEVETKEDALMISDTFSSIIKEKELKNEEISDEDVANYIFKYYIDRIYFEIDKHLFIDGKYAQIKKLKLRLLNKMSWDELIYNKLDPNVKGFVDREEREKEERFIDVEPSKVTRLAIDDVDSSYYVYLDVEVVFKNSPTDRIPIKDQINYGNDCIGKARVLDRLLWDALGINYPKRYLENKMRKKNDLFHATRKKTLLKSIPSAPKSKKEPVSEKSQTGGANKNLTRKIISKQKNKTMKNLVHYYTI